jgi:hypothetical protein
MLKAGNGLFVYIGNGNNSSYSYISTANPSF